MSVCGQIVQIFHHHDRSCSTTNMIQHIKIFTFTQLASHRLSWRRKSFVSMFVDTMHEPASWIIARCIKVNKQSTANVKDKYYELFRGH